MSELIHYRKTAHGRTPPTGRVTEFADKYRLRVFDTGTERVVPGKCGEVADMGDDGFLRVRLLAAPRSGSMNKALLDRTRRAIAGGLTLIWKADAESIFCFDPTNESQSRLAIELVGAFRRRVRNLNDEQRQALADRMRVVRMSRPATIAA